MSAITIQKNGKYSYIKLSESTWDKEKKQCRNKKYTIGMIDQQSGSASFKREFLEQLASDPELMQRIKKRFPNAQLSIPGITTRKTDIPENNTFKYFPGEYVKYGITYFLYNIANNIGLLENLKENFPETWKQIFTIASFLIVENEPLMYCDDFVEEHLTLKCGSLTSQRSSELLYKIKQRCCTKFYQDWHKLISEKEYIALDTTSISSYSKMPEVEFGKNKEMKKHRQVNVCLLYGENSKLPVFQTTYSGSMVDVSTLESTIQEFEAIVGSSKIIIVMDKGFYSDKNLRSMLDKKQIKFLLAVPFTGNKAKSFVEEYKNSKDLLKASNIIRTKNETIRGIYRYSQWIDKKKLHVHIFYDSGRAKRIEDNLLEEIADIKYLYLTGKLKKSGMKDLQKYFSINLKLPKTHKNHLIEKIDVVEEEIYNSGWLILLSNHVRKTQKALDLYRNKDAVEKAFESYKQNLGLRRFRIKDSKRLNNKVFIAFIAVIIKSHIEKVMLENDLFKKFTFKKLIKYIDKAVGFIDINNSFYLKEVTAQQKILYEIFQMPIPTSQNITEFITKTI